MENRPTETAAHDLVAKIENNFNAKLFTEAGFLDISSAFAAAWPPSILNALLAKSCPIYIVKIIKSFLEGRVGVLNDGNVMHECKIEIGYPQGSILSPFLWNILIDSIIRASFPFAYKIIADDIAILVRDRDPSRAVSSLQAICDRRVDCFKEILLDINGQKTIMMIFTRARSQLPPLFLNINQGCDERNQKRLRS